LGLALLLLAAAVSAQLVPMPWSSLESVSPATHSVLERVDLRFAVAPSVGEMPWHALSVRPGATLLGLGFFVAFAIFLLGAQIGLGSENVPPLLKGLAALGTVIAIISVVQTGLSSPYVYGFWQARFSETPGAPFINRNHLAGWMLMSVPVVAGYLLARLEAVSLPPPSWRRRFLWLTSSSGAEVFWLSFAVLVMTLALVLTRSRSGMIAASVALLLMVGAIIRGQRRRRAWIAVGGLSFALAVALWAGVDGIVSRFGEVQTTASQRVEAWKTAVRIVRDFFPWGTGLNTYGVATTIYEGPEQTLHFVEAHNDYLQIAAEGGLLIGIPAIIAACVLAREIVRTIRTSSLNRPDYWVRVGAAVGLVAIALQEAVEFSLQMPGNAVLFCTIAALAIRRGRPVGSPATRHTVAGTPPSGAGGLAGPLSRDLKIT
jgi:O-antigen ligase